MKHLIFGFAVIVLVSGCATKDIPPPTEQSGQYTVLIIEAEIQGSDLEGIYPELFRDPGAPPMEEQVESAITDLTSPTAQFTPKETVLLHAGSLPRPYIDQSTINRILNMPEAQIYEYPVFYATPGEPAICDQTESKEMLKDCKVAGGKPVKIMETVKLGHYAEIMITEVEDSNITCQLKMGSRSLHGTEAYMLGNGDQMEMPFFNHTEINTTMPLSDNKWAMSSGTVEEQTQDDTTTKSMKTFFIRITSNGSPETL